MLKTENLIRVRYAETDQMGFVYHSNFLIFMEAARIRMLDKWGFSYRQLEKEGYFLPVLEAQLKYHSPAHFDDTLAVEVTLKKQPLIRWTLHYEIFRVPHEGTEGNTRELLVTGQTSHAFIDRQGRPVKPPPEVKAFFQEKFASAPSDS